MRDRRSASGGGLGGVMGGAETEVSPATTDVADRGGRVRPALDPHDGPPAEPAQRFVVSLRARPRSGRSRLGQPPGCELILELAGGELAAGVIDVGRQPAAREPIVLRLSQLKRILGIDSMPPKSGAFSRRWAIASSGPTASESRSFRRAGVETCRARSTWSKKSRGFTATTRFPKMSACRWPHRPAAGWIACWRWSGKC